MLRDSRPVRILAAVDSSGGFKPARTKVLGSTDSNGDKRYVKWLFIKGVKGGLICGDST